MPINRSTLLQEQKEALLQKAQQVWRTADAVCFDVDSTVINEEGIDRLAELAGVGKEVSEMTSKAMSGSMTFQDALSLRLNIIKPTEDMVSKMRDRDVDTILTPGIRDVVDELRARNVAVYLVSGGFLQLIEPIAESLGIPKENIYANYIFFNEKGDYVGFDKTRLTCQSGGKPRAVATLKKQFNYQRVVMIGDGATDMEACPPAEAFIGFGGNQVREKVKQGAMWFVYSMRELLSVLHEDNDLPTSPPKTVRTINGFSHSNGAVANGHSNGAVANGHSNGAVANGHSNGAVANGHSNGAVANGHSNGALGHSSEVTVER